MGDMGDMNNRAIYLSDVNCLYGKVLIRRRRVLINLQKYYKADES
jgi:hypothetical protein